MGWIEHWLNVTVAGGRVCYNTSTQDLAILAGRNSVDA